MDAPEICELCARPVDPAEAYRAELSIGDLMCPTPMTFHPGCYEQAAELWQPAPDSMCVNDPEFPETMRWTPGPASGERSG